MRSETTHFQKPPALQAEPPLNWISIRLVDWWEKIIFFSLCLSVGLLGLGRVELPFLGWTFSSWSVSRTAFYFWLFWKLTVSLQKGLGCLEWRRCFSPFSLTVFIVFVTVSFLPYFVRPSDYPYMVFAFFHFLMIRDLFEWGNRPRVLLCLLGIAPGFLFIRGVITNPSVLTFDQMVRFGFPLDHPNTTGYVFCMAIPIALAVIASERGWLRTLAGVSLGAQFIGLLLTYSRAAWAGGFISILSLGLTERRSRKVIFVLGVVAFAIFALTGPIRGRLVSISDAMDDPHVVWRFQVMAHAVFLGLDAPFLGVGYGRDRLRTALGEKYPSIAKQRYIAHSHNLYTELLAGTGFLGLGAFLWLLFSTLNRLVTKIRSDQHTESRSLYPCFLASLIAFMVAGLGDVPFYHHETRIFFFTLLGLIYIQR